MVWGWKEPKGLVPLSVSQLLGGSYGIRGQAMIFNEKDSVYRKQWKLLNEGGKLACFALLFAVAV